MQRLKPSASMVVAITALVVASTGTAIAAGLVSGDKLIRKSSLSGNRLRKHTVTGTQINLRKLGKVPNARNADHATSADSATTATSAVTAVNATNAVNAVTAAGVTGVTHFIKTIAPAGSTAATAATVTLGTSGPLTVYGACYTNATGTDAATYLKSSVAGFWNAFTGNPTTDNQPLAANTPVDVSQSDANALPGVASYRNPYDGTFSAITGSLGNYITGIVSDGVNLTSANDCTFAGFTSAS